MPFRINHKASSENKCKSQINKDNIMKDVSGMNPDEISQYVDDNVKSVPDIKKFLVMLLTNQEATK